jgi:hypothetical protein
MNNDTKTITLTGDFVALVERESAAWLTHRINKFGIMRDGGDIEVPMTRKQQQRLFELVVRWRYSVNWVTNERTIVVDQHLNLLHAGITL